MEEKRLEEQRLQREQQLEMQKMQLEQQYEEQRKQREFQEMKWREDRAYKESTAVQIKTWGDALRNMITKMPSEGIDVVSWFVSIVTNGGSNLPRPHLVIFYFFFRLPRISRKSSDTDTV